MLSAGGPVSEARTKSTRHTNELFCFSGAEPVQKAGFGMKVVFQRGVDKLAAARGQAHQARTPVLGVGDTLEVAGNGYPVELFCHSASGPDQHVPEFTWSALEGFTAAP